MTNLHNTGLLRTHARDLFSEADFALLLDQTERWLESDRLQEEVRKYQAGTRQADFKPFCIRYSEKREYKSNDALLPIANEPKLRAIVESAIGPAKLYCVDLWHNPAGCNQRQKVWSQSWHRDPEAAQLIKAFVYLSNVDEDCGPFEYVLCSPWCFFDVCPPGSYPGDKFDQSVIPEQLFVKAAGKRGTVVLANTSGLHQGGHGSKPRTMAVLTFVPETHPVGPLYKVKD